MRRYCDCSFDRGFGPGVVRSRNSVVHGHWNRVRVYCNSWNGYVQLNDGPTAKGKPKVRYQACVCARARACVCVCVNIRKSDEKELSMQYELWCITVTVFYPGFCDFLLFQNLKLSGSHDEHRPTETRESAKREGWRKAFIFWILKKSNDSDSHRLVPYSSVASFTGKAVGPAWVSHSQTKNDFTVSEF